MDVQFKNRKVKKIFETQKLLIQKHGSVNAEKITQRINELVAADCLFDMPPIARTHPLTGRDKGKFAVDIKHPFRLIFKPIGEFEISDPKTIKSIMIIEVKDYH